MEGNQEVTEYITQFCDEEDTLISEQTSFAPPSTWIQGKDHLGSDASQSGTSLSPLFHLPLRYLYGPLALVLPLVVLKQHLACAGSPRENGALQYCWYLTVQKATLIQVTFFAAEHGYSRILSWRSCACLSVRSRDPVPSETPHRNPQG